MAEQRDGAIFVSLSLYWTAKITNKKNKNSELTISRDCTICVIPVIWDNFLIVYQVWFGAIYLFKIYLFIREKERGHESKWEQKPRAWASEITATQKTSARQAF